MPRKPVLVNKYQYQIICELVADGATDREIAERLETSVDSVKSQMKRLLTQTQTENRTELAVKVLRGIIHFQVP